MKRLYLLRVETKSGKTGSCDFVATLDDNDGSLIRCELNSAVCDDNDTGYFTEAEEEEIRQTVRAINYVCDEDALSDYVEDEEELWLDMSLTCEEES